MGGPPTARAGRLAVASVVPVEEVALAVGLVHPGAMGAAVGAALRAAGTEVCWASEGRSPATADRAVATGLTDLRTVAALVRRCSLVLSICPPHAALAVARQVAGAGFAGCYVDANAVSPATARAVAAAVEAAGGHYVDGGLIGSPPAPGRPVHLWLSGGGADEVAGRFEGTEVRARVVRAGDTAASALKAAFAAWTKGSAALLLAVRSLARASGVEDELLLEWADRLPGLVDESNRAAGQAALKGWRWVGEMHEIAASFAAVGLPPGFHEAAAEIYAAVEGEPDLATDPPSPGARAG